MTRPTAEYLAWIDEAVRLLRQRIATTSVGDGSVQALDRITIASLLANREVLVRHEPQIDEYKQTVCSSCLTGTGAEGRYEFYASFPCPTYLGVTKHLDEVM